MLDVNLLSKNVRAKKEKEIERIIMAAPKLADQTKGLKAAKKPASINFFSRFFKKSAPKPAVQDAPIAVQSILQTPKEVLPPAPAQIPPSPLKPIPVPEVMKAQPPQKPPAPTPVQPKPAPAIIKKPSDGIILPDISSIVQKNIEKPAIQIPIIPPKIAEPAAPKKPAIPPLPPIKKIEIIQVSVGAENKVRPPVSAAPQKLEKPQSSVLRIGFSGVLTIAFAASFVAGSFFVLNRWVSAFEKVEDVYEERSQSVNLITSLVDSDIQEALILMEKTQLLSSAYQRQETDDKKMPELRPKIITAASDFIDSPAVSFAYGTATLSGILKQDKTVDDAASVLTSLIDPAVDKIIKKEMIGKAIIVQFSVK